MKLIVDNSPKAPSKDHLLHEAVRAYWQAVRDFEEARRTHNSLEELLDSEIETILDREDAAIERLVPLRTPSPRGLAQKVEILEKMIETERASEQIAEFAASIAGDALSMSRRYLNCPLS